MAPSIERKLRIQFQKSLRKGHVTNAWLDPGVPGLVQQMAEPNEIFIVRVDPKQGGHYWFSDRRVLSEDPTGARELLRYGNVRRTHWMFKDFWKDRELLLQGPDLKRKYYDRLEIEVQSGLVVLEELDQAYSPILNFFLWIRN
jgi:hypothetical protein